MKRQRSERKKRIGAFLAAVFLCAACILLPVCPAYAAESWPTIAEGVTAEAAICMDADSGAILYGKNISETHFPASITKIMTALLVLENCDLDDTVTFSETAVNNLEAGAVTAFTSAGDTLSVRDCLYALLFRSANDVANALAEHVSGSIEAFSEEMNSRAKELGCLNTHFSNPSGLNAEDHYTTAYDMALIARACMDNKLFLELESTDTYKIGATAERPDGLTVRIGHKMKRSGTDYTDARVVAGKTGYTSLAGNTLVTMAEEGDRRLVTVVLQDKNPMHYTDTAAMFDLGFGSFENVSAKALFDETEVEKRLLADAVLPQGEGTNHLETDRTLLVSVPNGTALSELETRYDYNLPANAPEDAVAKLSFYYGDHTAGSYFITNSRESALSIMEVPTPAKVAIFSISLTFVAGMATFSVLGGGTVWHVRNVHAEKKQLARLRERRRDRLRAMGVSEEEFQALLDRKHGIRQEGTQAPAKRTGRSRYGNAPSAKRRERGPEQRRMRNRT